MSNFEDAKEKKELGNAHFARGDNADAIVQYEAAIAIAAPLSRSDDKPVAQEAKALLRSLLLNVAACRLRTLDYETCARTCTAVLDLDPKCAKAYYRRCKALAGMGMAEDALEDAKEAKKWAPGDAAISRTLNELEEQVEADRRAEAAGDAAEDGIAPEDIPDDLPPLDDMEDYLVSRGVKVPTESGGGAADRNQGTKKKATAKKGTAFKKGFLSKGLSDSGAGKTSAGTAGGAGTSPSAKETIRARDGAPSNPLVMEDVQEAMRSSAGLAERQGEWLNNDLLARLASNPKLAKGIMRPDFNDAVSLFSSNPQKAMEKYGQNEEVMGLFRELTGAMGDHFSKVGDAQEEKEGKSKSGAGTASGAKANKASAAATSVPAPTSRAVQPAGPPISSDDAAKADAFASSPEGQQFLMDPDVQKIITLIRTQPQSQELMMMMRDPRYVPKFRKMMELGLIGTG